jgi:hypothetical protein
MTSKLLLSIVKKNMSGSLNAVPSKIICEYMNFYLTTPILKIINNSIKENEFPNAFKESIISPIYKNRGKKTDTSNYRPISCTDFMGKLIERVVKAQLNEWLEASNYLSPYQFGFRKGHSTVLALANLHEYAIQVVDKKKLYWGSL